MTREFADVGPPDLRSGKRQRGLILTAACEIVRERSAEALTVAQIATRSGVSARTVKSLFPDPREGITAAFEDAVTVIEACVVACYRAREDPLDGIRAGVAATLVFFDEQPEFAWLCLVHGPACPELLPRCRQLSDNLASAIDRAFLASSPAEPPPWTAYTVVGSVLGAVRTHVLDGCGQLSTMVGSLMAMIVLPYLGPDAAHLELVRDAAARRREA
jgi:AcrR family transcriptional regulator